MRRNIQVFNKGFKSNPNFLSFFPFTLIIVKSKSHTIFQYPAYVMQCLREQVKERIIYLKKL